MSLISIDTLVWSFDGKGMFISNKFWLKFSSLAPLSTECWCYVENVYQIISHTFCFD